MACPSECVDIVSLRDQERVEATLGDFIAGSFRAKVCINTAIGVFPRMLARLKDNLSSACTTALVPRSNHTVSRMRYLRQPCYHTHSCLLTSLIVVPISCAICMVVLDAAVHV